MKKLLFIALVFTPLVQASIAQEDAEAILNEMGANKHYPEESDFDQKAFSLAQRSHSLVQFAKACAFHTPDMTLKFNWTERIAGSPMAAFRPNSINCSGLADVMEKMAKNTEKYDSDTIDRLERSINEIRTAK